MSFKDLTPEQREKAKTAKTPEDILALAKEEGYELSIEALDASAVFPCIAFSPVFFSSEILSRFMSYSFLASGRPFPTISHM